MRRIMGRLNKQNPPVNGGDDHACMDKKSRQTWGLAAESLPRDACLRLSDTESGGGGA
jgi:hypothetical protein